MCNLQEDKFAHRTYSEGLLEPLNLSLNLEISWSFQVLFVSFSANDSNDIATLNCLSQKVSLGSPVSKVNLLSVLYNNLMAISLLGSYTSIFSVDKHERLFG